MAKSVLGLKLWTTEQCYLPPGGIITGPLHTAYLATIHGNGIPDKQIVLFMMSVKPIAGWLL